MSIHPNAILLLALKPNGLARQTLRAILDGAKVEDADDGIKIGEHDYVIRVMESDYAKDYQISADEGDICLFDMVTYGYGERIEWDELIAQKAELETWAGGICERHACSAKFFVTANYW